MPPEQRNVAARAASLRSQLNAAASSGGGVDAVAAAHDARTIFEDAGDTVRARWLALELDGYGASQARPVHEALGVSPNERLVAHVTGYRMQRGEELSPRPGSGRFAHFFVEGLPDLVVARDRTRRLSASRVEVQLRPEPPSGYPTSAEFPRDVFERIVQGFLAALFLQLGTVTG